MPLALLKTDFLQDLNPNQLSALEKFRLLAVEERKKMIKVVRDFDDPIEQGRTELAQIQKETEGKEPLQQGISTIEDLLKLGQTVNPYFEAVIQSVANATSSQTIFPGLKSRERIEAKIKGEYKDKGVSAIRDVVRASIVFEDLESIYQAVEHLYGSVQIVFVEDRFLNPTEAGYSDMKLYIKLPTPEGGTFITELQLHLSEMLEAKKIETQLYEKRRDLEIELKQLSQTVDINYRTELESRIAAYRAEGKLIYQKAAEKYHLKNK